MAINEIGQQIKSIYSWIWLNVFLFWLIFPPIVLLVKWFNLASITNAQNDPGLTEAGGKLSTAMIMLILPFGITQIIGVILFISYYGSMEAWAGANNRGLAATGFGQVKTAMILNLIPLGITQLIGLIMFLIGFPKAGNGML